MTAKSPRARPRVKLSPRAKARQAATPSASNAERAAAGAVEREGQQRLRVKRTHDLIAALAPLLNGYAGGDHEMALSALATVTGQVVAMTPNPPQALAYVVRVAQETAGAIVEHARAQQAAQAQAEKVPG